jgi:hypothetical protein
MLFGIESVVNFHGVARRHTFEGQIMERLETTFVRPIGYHDGFLTIEAEPVEVPKEVIDGAAIVEHDLSWCDGGSIVLVSWPSLYCGYYLTR